MRSPNSPDRTNNGHGSFGFPWLALSGTNDFGAAAVSILAAGDIKMDDTGFITTAGHRVVIIAGATVTMNGDAKATSSKSGQLTSTSGAGIARNVLTADLKPTNGGNIEFSAGECSAIKTTGASVTLIANSHGATDGRILLANDPPIWTIDTANPKGNGGNVTIIAGANSKTNQPSIRLGNIRTSAAVPYRSGFVQITTAPPAIANGKFEPNGTTSATFGIGSICGDASSATGRIMTAGSGGKGDGQNGTAAKPITITAGGNITTGDLEAFGGGGVVKELGFEDFDGKNRLTGREVRVEDVEQ